MAMAKSKECQRCSDYTAVPPLIVWHYGVCPRDNGASDKFNFTDVAILFGLCVVLYWVG